MTLPMALAIAAEPAGLSGPAGWAGLAASALLPPGTLGAVLAVLPFLPPGRGALILILGGLIVLPFSLLMSRIGAGRPSPALHTPQARHPDAGASMQMLTVPGATAGARRAWEAGSAVAVAPVPVAFHETPHHAAHAPAPRPEAPAAPAERPWQGTAMERALRTAVGGTTLLAAAPGHYVVSLGRCDSCARRLSGCGLERAAIERAMGPYFRQVAVLERTCAQRRRRAQCTFDIRGS
ncbi:MAG TPA: hypothetical protein VM286_05480 [Candidatus Thermoplasmatota archaeon]|nr:hypothetical protein [Candidatus Thermoplasmatota archaeon]